MYLSVASLLALAAVTVADNTVTFESLDDVDRTIYFTPNQGRSPIEPAVVPGNQTLTVDIPHGWVGNWYSVSDGAENRPGMLGEVNFNSWQSLTFFDVSTIVNSEFDMQDWSGVKQIYPAASPAPVSGCPTYGPAIVCEFAYNLPDDIQTMSTLETDLICTLGGDHAAEETAALETASTDIYTKRSLEKEHPVFPRSFVTEKWSNSVRRRADGAS